MGNVAKASSKNVEWIECNFQFNDVQIKRYDEESNEGYFLEADV